MKGELIDFKIAKRPTQLCRA